MTSFFYTHLSTTTHFRTFYPGIHIIKQYSIYITTHTCSKCESSCPPPTSHPCTPKPSTSKPSCTKASPSSKAQQHGARNAKSLRPRLPRWWRSIRMYVFLLPSPRFAYHHFPPHQPIRTSKFLTLFQSLQFADAVHRSNSTPTTSKNAKTSHKNLACAKCLHSASSKTATSKRVLRARDRRRYARQLRDVCRCANTLIIDVNGSGSIVYFISFHCVVVSKWGKTLEGRFIHPSPVFRKTRPRRRVP